MMTKELSEQAVDWNVKNDALVGAGLINPSQSITEKLPRVSDYLVTKNDHDYFSRSP
jgi:hypothetical protein